MCPIWLVLKCAVQNKSRTDVFACWRHRPGPDTSTCPRTVHTCTHKIIQSLILPEGVVGGHIHRSEKINLGVSQYIQAEVHVAVKLRTSKTQRCKLIISGIDCKSGRGAYATNMWLERMYEEFVLDRAFCRDNFFQDAIHLSTCSVSQQPIGINTNTAV